MFVETAAKLAPGVAGGAYRQRSPSSRAGSSPARSASPLALLCLLLVARLTLAERPFAGWSACARRDGRRAGPVRGLDAASRRAGRTRPRRALVGVRSRAAVPPHAGVRRACTRGRPGRAARCCCAGSALAIAVTCCGRARHAPAAGDVPDQRGRQQRAARVPAHLLERDGHVLRRSGAVLLTHLTASEREPGGRARRGGRGAAGRRGDALLHVLARRASRRRSSASSSTCVLAHPRGSRRRAARRRPAGRRRAAARVRLGAARPRRLRRGGRARAGPRAAAWW